MNSTVSRLFCQHSGDENLALKDNMGLEDAQGLFPGIFFLLQFPCGSLSYVNLQKRIIEKECE